MIGSLTGLDDRSSVNGCLSMLRYRKWRTVHGGRGAYRRLQHQYGMLDGTIMRVLAADQRIGRHIQSCTAATYTVISCRTYDQ